MDNTVQIYWERYNEDMRKAYARGLRAAARKARHEMEVARIHAGWHIDHLEDIRLEGMATQASELSSWCDRRARAVERGK